MVDNIFSSIEYYYFSLLFCENSTITCRNPRGRTPRTFQLSAGRIFKNLKGRNHKNVDCRNSVIYKYSSIFRTDKPYFIRVSVVVWQYTQRIPRWILGLSDFALSSGCRPLFLIPFYNEAVEGLLKEEGKSELKPKCYFCHVPGAGEGAAQAFLWQGCSYENKFRIPAPKIWN